MTVRGEKEHRFRSVAAMVKADVPIAEACARVGVSRSGYRYWRDRHKRQRVIRGGHIRADAPMGPYAQAWWARALREARLARGITLDDLGRRCGYRADSIAMWEKGVTVPKVNAVEEVFAAMGVRMGIAA